MVMKLVVVVVVLGLVEVARGWGPMSHYDMGCNAFYGVEDIISCSQLKDGNQSMQGMALPDAFFFGGDFTTGSNCSATLSYLHDGVFAGYMVQLANNTNRQQLAFSLGFGSHVISDTAGFTNGYLSGPIVHWLSVWQNMLAQDAYIADFWQENFGRSQADILAEVQIISEPISQEQAEWVSTATSYYNSFNSNFEPVSADALLACSKVWSAALESVSSFAVEKESSCYEAEMVYYDEKAADWTSAQKRYTRFNTCGVGAVLDWRDGLYDGQDPETAYKNSVLYVEKHCPK